MTKLKVFAGPLEFDARLEGHVIFYPAGISETDILLACGGIRFASKVGQLAGNHFIAPISGLEELPELSKLTLWQRAQPTRFERA
jgi:hypothetical protein